MSRAAKKMGTLGPGNFREYAQSCIEKYSEKGMLVDAMLWHSEKGMLVDAMLWSSIVGHYNHALDEALQALRSFDPALAKHIESGGR